MQCLIDSCIRNIKDKYSAPKSSYAIERTCRLNREGNCPVRRGKKKSRLKTIILNTLTTVYNTLTQ